MRGFGEKLPCASARPGEEFSEEPPLIPSIIERYLLNSALLESFLKDDPKDLVGEAPPLLMSRKNDLDPFEPL